MYLMAQTGEPVPSFKKATSKLILLIYLFRWDPRGAPTYREHGQGHLPGRNS
jgi:hypothetical protein